MQGDGSFGWSEQGVFCDVGVFIGFGGCEGPRPSESGSAIEALIVSLEGARSLGAALSRLPLRTLEIGFGFCKMTTCATFLPRWRAMISLSLGEAALDIRLLPSLAVRG